MKNRLTKFETVYQQIIKECSLKPSSIGKHLINENDLTPWEDPKYNIQSDDYQNWAYIKKYEKMANNIMIKVIRKDPNFVWEKIQEEDFNGEEYTYGFIMDKLPRILTKNCKSLFDDEQDLKFLEEYAKMIGGEQGYQSAEKNDPSVARRVRYVLSNSGLIGVIKNNGVKIVDPSRYSNSPWDI